MCVCIFHMSINFYSLTNQPLNQPKLAFNNLLICDYHVDIHMTCHEQNIWGYDYYIINSYCWNCTSLYIQLVIYVNWSYYGFYKVFLPVLTTPLTILRDCIYSCTAASKSAPSSKGLAFHLISSVLTVILLDVDSSLTVHRLYLWRYVFQLFLVFFQSSHSRFIHVNTPDSDYFIE